jgi:ABC-2 type transport system ATP-binding protein
MFAQTFGCQDSRHDADRSQRPMVTAPGQATARAGDGGWSIETNGLTKRYGATTAVHDVALRVPRGCAFGYLGPNGAGKTTLIRLLLGLTRADGGTMSLGGIEVPAHRRQALARVGAIVDEPRFHRHLSGQENLLVLAAARGDGARAAIGPALERVGLAGHAKDRVGSYSMGMRQRLGLAACLLGDPELLILDEPMNGLDPAGMQDMRGMIRGLVDEGRTVLLSSHLLDEIERTCDAVAIVDHGTVIRQGPIDTLLRDTVGVTVEVGCDAPAAAAELLTGAGLAATVTVTATGLMLTLPAGAGRDRVAEVNRRLVEAGFAVDRIHDVRTSLEDWFLSVTSRLGDASPGGEPK